MEETKLMITRFTQIYPYDSTYDSPEMRKRLIRFGVFKSQNENHHKQSKKNNKIRSKVNKNFKI